jgi:elongation factor G
MTVVPTERIRNVLLLGHTGTGKSTLVEAMLRAAGHPVTHDGRPATVDVEPEEIERGHSLSLSLVSFEFEGHKLNILDAPGGAEAVGDAYPALLAADTALFVVDATVGLQPQHLELWRACEERGLPRVVLLNKLDLERARYREAVDELSARYGTPLAPVHVPLWHDDRFEGVIDLLHVVAVEEHDGLRRELPLTDEEHERTDRHHDQLVEAIVETDDDLLTRYLEGQQPSVAELANGFAHGIASGAFFPVLCASARSGIGVDLLLRFLLEECPSPADVEPVVSADTPTTAYVAKTFSDQYIGRINLLRVLSGHLRPDDQLLLRRTGRRQRLHQLFGLRGAEHLPVDGAATGDLVAVGKLDDVLTGDLLSAEPLDVEIDAPRPPDGLHRVVLEPAAAGDDAKLSVALQRIVQEDPAIGVTHDEDTSERIVTFLGPTHVEVTVARLARRYGVQVEAGPAPVAYRSTIRRAASATGRHVKQSGGHGQYAIAGIEIEPRPRGAGFAFENVSVGGVVPGSYVPSVEKGVIEAMRSGPLGGFPVVDVDVRLVDGKHHAVDSSDAAFQMAGILAFRAAVAEADPVLLEPISAVRVTVPDELTGPALSDLSSRRGRIVATSAAGLGWSRIEAHVPEAEIATFASDLRALTRGQGSAQVAYDHHAEVPEPVARRVLEGMVTDR